MMTEDQLGKARAGDGEAFRALTDPYRRELQAHCYRMLASAQDAEDAMQETLLAAWRAIGEFEQRSSLRTWLYRIATNRCLNALRSAERRPAMAPAPDFIDPAARTRKNEVIWLEPYPDVLLDGLPDDQPGPAARYETKETMSLAFVTALQLLPPRQRAVVVLRDVLGYTAPEVAEMLDTTAESVSSALKRARATLDRNLITPDREPAPDAGSAQERELVAQLTAAYAAGDINSLLELLTDDVRISMPPLPFEYEGVHAVAQGLGRMFTHSPSFELVETRANGQPAFAIYIRDDPADILHAFGLLVLTLTGRRIGALTHFDNSVLARFGLPRTRRA